MKILSRDFTLKEKVLLLILCLVLVGLAYYRFVFVPCQDAISRANNTRDALQIELLGAMTKEAQLKKMKDELDSLGELRETSRMDSYNNAKAELSLLNSVLEAADEYAVSFASVTKDGDQIRRNFSLQFQTGSFAAAKQIVARLSESEYRCLLGDIQYSSTVRVASEKEKTVGGYWDGEVYYFNVITVNTTATFFETMYGGTPDAGLPADKSA